ncbi:MAG: ABC transporter substrate-binding protein [Phreatobacter sp.]|uniref:ABC transporter substrate-binding protein n=1 Tax=Phreatobacter sp. TaxID=1966341 RepID=UPI001A3E9CDC|nr:ABC transporter substrate-binding protein [Phreatobacter sp.]MBL8569313.1 ABC transporter substrate-binding protein [Phreatobacter sp.]
MAYPTITRRNALAGATALGVAGIIRPREARAETTLTVVLESEVVIFDPHFTTAAITRTFGYHIFDTLFAMDGMGEIRPQMVSSYDTSPDKLTWTFTLRDGLKWHDGAPVTAAECVASINRWAPRDAIGRMLRAATAAMAAKDDKTFSIVLKEPFPLMLPALGKANAPLPVMMPMRFASTPSDQRITVPPVGSGPFRFRADLWKSGNSMILERNPDYVPRAEPADFLAGGRSVKIDRLDLRVMPDQMTGASALIKGEIDYMQYLPFDSLSLLRRARDVKLLGIGGIHQFQGNFRLNHEFPPFNDPAVRRVLWKLADQSSILSAIGIPAEFRAPQCPSFWMCDAPLSTTAGSEVAKVDIEAARAALKATSYAGQPVIILEVAGSISQTAAQVLSQNMKDAGFTVDAQTMDWGTVLARRAKKDGWSMFSVYSNGTDMISPLNHFYIASTCADFPGWSCDTRIPDLLKAFARADDQAGRKKVAEEIQRIAYELTPAVMWGQFTIPAGYRSNLRDLPQSSYPMFWDVSRQ